MSNKPDVNLDLTEEETAEFADTLKSLESTMKKHMQAMAVKKSAKPSSVVAPMPAPAPAPQLKLKREPTRLKDKADAVVITRSDKVTVFVRIVFLKVGEIDTLRDRFAADVFIQSKWREPAMDGQFSLKTEPINWDKYWSPKLFIENAIGEPKESIWHTVTFDSSGQATVVEKRRSQGSFFEFMELNQFPFDSQDMTVCLGTEREESELEFIEDPMERSALNVQSFVDEQEWKLHKSVNAWTKTRKEEFKQPEKIHSSFAVASKASRRPQFFIWNIFLVMFLICSLSFSTFAVSLVLPQNRLQLTFILLLTTVSFKFVVNQSLPMISYLTYLDKYILTSMGILVCICIWHAVINKIWEKLLICDTDRAQLIDNIVLGAFASFYLGFHIIFVGLAVNLARENADADDDGDNNEDRNMDQAMEENGNLPENFLDDALDMKSIRRTKADDATDNATQQAVMSAWQ